MLSAEEFLDLLNCTIRFSTPEGDVYEGLLKRVVPANQSVTIGKLYLLPKRTKMGVLRFAFRDISNVVVMHWPEPPKEISGEKKQDTSLYVRTEVDELFDLYGDSENEDEARTDKIPKLEEYIMKLPPHLSNCVPAESCIIDSLNDDFNLAIQRITEEDSIGLSLEGPKISRSGILTWLCISTSSCVYLFDIIKLGEAVFKSGLKSILENSRIQKILHDCRLPSDCLYHQYNVRLVNVFDTQVADSLALMQEIVNKRISKRVNSLDVCLQYFLEIPDDHLYGPRNFVVDENSINFHGLRPLRHEFRDLMIQKVMYLPLLKRELEFALLTPLRRATEIYLNAVQKASDYELLVAPFFPDELPPELTLEGIQIVRFQEFEYIPPVVSSGPPYRKFNNPFEEYKEYCKKYNIGWRKNYSSAVDRENCCDGSIQKSGVYEAATKQRTVPKLKQLINSKYDDSCSGVGNFTIPMVENSKNDDSEENESTENSSVDNFSSKIPASENQTYDCAGESIHPSVEQPSTSDLEQMLSRRELRQQTVLKEYTAKKMQKNNYSEDSSSSLDSMDENLNDGAEEKMHSSVEQPSMSDLEQMLSRRELRRQTVLKEYTAKKMQKNKTEDSSSSVDSMDENLNDGAEGKMHSSVEQATTSDLEQVLSRVKLRGAALRAYNCSEVKSSENRKKINELLFSKSTFQMGNCTIDNKENKNCSFVPSLHSKDEGSNGTDVSVNPVDKNTWQPYSQFPGVETFSDIDKRFCLEAKNELPQLQPVFANSDDIWAKLRAEYKNDYPYDETRPKLNLIPAGMGC